IPGGMGGKEAIQKILTIDPQAKALVSSGYSSDPVMAEYMEYGFCGVISKPYSFEELESVLSEILTSPNKV
ncbi:response regulator, partial [bacterium]|nr:response regulator [bacterium]